MFLPLPKFTGQGSWHRCPVCNKLFDVKPTGRPRKFCSDLCRQDHHRSQAFRDNNHDLAEGPYRPSSLSRNSKKTLTKSTANPSTFADRTSPIKAFGRGCYAPTQVAADTPDRRALIRAALRIESEARWRLVAAGQHLRNK
jgi:hypothetical protein